MTISDSRCVTLPTGRQAFDDIPLFLGSVMQSTLLMFRILPPPPARANILTRLYGHGATTAADTNESFRMQRIDIHFIFCDVFMDIFQRPIGQGVDLYFLVLPIPFKRLNIAARDGLRPAQAAYPGIKPFQRPL